MANFYSYFIIGFSAIFSVVNPLGAVPAFLAMTADDSRSKQRSMAKRASWIALGVLVICGAIGSFLFRFFGITLPAVKIAGGCLLFLIAVDMLNARQSRARSTAEEAEEGVIKEDIAVFPLAVPLLSGPGSIVTVFILMEKASTPVEHLALYLGMGLTMFLSFLMLSEASRLTRIMGRIGMNVFSRIMGLILAAIAAQFIIDGIKEALPGLKG
ncbi:MAG: MarC family protein [Bdellovibrionales bacterium]|nr:MarC family protein [Bdellovibrionales bacterium]